MARRSDGKMDRRTTGYREAADRMAKARAVLARDRREAVGPRRRADGGLDQRTREGREVAARMEAARARRGTRRKGFFAWLFGG